MNGRCFELLLAAVLTVASFLQVMAQTKPDFAAGKSAGSFSLSDFDAVNLYNGNLLLNLPLLRIGGRGQTGYSMGLNINSLNWMVENESVGGGGTEHVCPNGGCGDRYIVTYTNTEKIYTILYTCIGFTEPCRFTTLSVTEIDSTIVLDGTPLEGEGAVAPEVTYYNVSPSNIQKVNPGYGPGVVRALTDRKWNRTWRGTLTPGSALTRIVFTAPDGSEYQLVDDQTNGQVTRGGTTAAFPYNRGRNFHSIDGSAMTFISDADIIEDFGSYIIPGPITQNPSGYLLLSDGARYRVVNGLIVWIRDRNGNQTNFSYDTGGRVNIVTDSLGRTATVEYGLSGGGTSTYDRIKYSVSGEIDRYVKVWKDSLQNSLYGAEQIGTYGSLFSQYEQDPINASTIFNPARVKSVELPDGRRYEIRYNSYGEIAAVILPTGGKIEYDYMPVYSPLQVQRRVKERRVFKSSADATPELTEKYTADFQGGLSQQPETHVTVERKQGDALLSKTKHYFHGNVTAGQLGLYSPWKDGREYKTETFAADGTTVLRSVEMTWRPKAFFIWYNNGAESNYAPADSPRIVETKTTLLDVSPALVTKTTSINPNNQNEIGFDQFNNPTDVWEYGFGQGEPGQLLRHKHIDYLTTSSVNGIDYTTNDVHIRRLSAGAKVYGYKNGQEVLLSRSEVKYDETPLEPRSDVVGWTDPQTAARGLVTTTKTWINTTDASVDQNSPQAYIQTQAKYDVLGNVVESTDGRGKKSYIYYDDNFGFADDEARQNNPPSQLNGQSTFAFATKVANDLGHTAYTQFNYFTGATVNTEDANGIVSSVAYNDALDRPTQGIQARYKVGVGIPAERRQTTITYDDANRVITTTSDLSAFADNILTSKAYYDRLGRTWRGAAREGATWTITDTQFDALGRVSQVSNPYRAADPGSASPPSGALAAWTKTDYDAIGRVIRVTTPDGAHVDTSYSGNQVTVIDQAVKKRRSETDALGRLIKVTEDPGGLNYETYYSYDELDNLRLVTQGAQTRTFVYDSLSRLISATNPESGTMTYAYDPNGNLIEKTDARGVKTTMTYDALNRVRSKVYSGTTPEGTAAANLTPPVNYFYDAYSGLPSGAPSWSGTPSKGRLTGVTYGPGSEGTYYKYDAAGRVVTKHQRMGTSNYVATYFYNIAGAVYREDRGSPARRRNWMSYDAAGRLLSMQTGIYNAFGFEPRDLVNFISYTSFGGLQSETYGNGLVHSMAYNSRHQPTEIRLGRQDDLESVFRLGYIYGAAYNVNSQDAEITTAHNNGNVARVKYVISGTVQYAQTFQYDPFNRLRYAVEHNNGVYNDGSRAWYQTFDYDQFGNRGIDGGNTSDNLDGANTALQLGEFSAANNRITRAGCAYDVAGNLIAEPGKSYTYDAENRLVTATVAGGVTSQYFYDGNGRRVRKIVGGVGTRFEYGAGGELIAEWTDVDSGRIVQKDYFYKGGELLATSKVGSSALYEYATADHLGSPRAWTDDSGVLIAGGRHDYCPFGEELSADIGIRSASLGYGADGIRQKFDGYERDAETSLDFAQARYYSSVQGRFTSPDPLIASAILGDPQSWNRYSFVGNRPLIYIDPTGLQWGRSTATGEYKWFGDTGGVVPDGWEKISIGTEYVAIDDCRVVLQAGGYWDYVRPPQANICALCDSEIGFTIAKIATYPWMVGAGVISGGAIGGVAVATSIYENETQGPLRLGTEENVTVGRWMSQTELEAMQKTGKVQESYTGTTHVAYPADSAAYGKQASPGDVYVEFEVPASAVKATQPGWAKILGPNTVDARLLRIKGQPVPQLPAANNIRPIVSKIR